MISSRQAAVLFSSRPAISCFMAPTDDEFSRPIRTEIRFMSVNGLLSRMGRYGLLGRDFVSIGVSGWD